MSISGPKVSLPGIRLFGKYEFFELMGITLVDERYVTTGEWFLNLETIRENEPDESVIAFFEYQFKKCKNWNWTPLSFSSQKANSAYLFGLLERATKRIEITAVSYHPRTGAAYRVCMIEADGTPGSSPTPIWVDEKFIEIFDRCRLDLHATGGPLDPVLLKGKDSNGDLCTYGLVMPVDYLHGGEDGESQGKLSMDLFEVMNRYPKITIDPRHFNIAGHTEETMGKVGE